MATKTTAPATKSEQFDQCMKRANDALHEAQIQLGKASIIMGDHGESQRDGYSMFIAGDIFSAEFQVSDIAKRVRSMRRQYVKRLS